MHAQKRAEDYRRNMKGENHENVKYRKEQDDYAAEGYNGNYGNYYDLGGSYQDNRRISSKDYKNSYSSDSALQKLKKLIQNKPDALITVKLHNFSYCVNENQAEPRKGFGRKFSNFDNLLDSIFHESFPNSQKEIRLYYISFSVKGHRLFETNGQCSFSFQSQDIREVISRQTNLVTTNKKATLDVTGQENFRIQFSLGNKQDTILTNDGTELIIFDPELRISNDCFRYRMLAFVKPVGLSAEKTGQVMYSFSKLMSKPKDVAKFIEIYGNLPNFKILTKEISTGPQDDLIFSIFKPFVKETQMNTVQIDFCRASVAMYQCAIRDKGPVNEFLRSDVQIPEGSFYYVKDTAGPVMRSLFNEALDMLRLQAHEIAQGGDLAKIRAYIMQCLRQLFEVHRKRTRNNEKYHEFENHFGAFQRSMKQKQIY